MHIDQDAFFNSRLGKPMPKTWSPIQQRDVTLYDDESAIDWFTFTNAIKACRARRIIAITGVSGSGKSTLAGALTAPDDILILTGFYLPPWILTRYGIRVSTYIILVGVSAELCIERRRVSKATLSKKFNADADAWMVRNHVMPFYENGVHAIPTTVPQARIDASQAFPEVLETAKKMFETLVL
jgi:hypothetical protein